MLTANNGFDLRKIRHESHEQSYLNFEQNPWKIRVNQFIFRVCNFTSK